MPKSRRPKPLYQRGDFRLYPRPGRNHEILWYDATGKRERCASAGTRDDTAARLALDRFYLSANGQRVCATCGRPTEDGGAPLLTRAITDYLLGKEGSAGYAATSGRLAHVVDYLAATDPATTCAQADGAWVDRFRAWLAARPVAIGKTGRTRARSLGHVEGCVLQLAAAINAAPGQHARFAALQPRTVAASPRYRADVATLAAMFRFCLYPPAARWRTDKHRAYLIGARANLLAYLRAAVATWARPEEIFDLGPGQWTAAAAVLDLNPPGRRQTRKYRTRIPVARQFRRHLDAMAGGYLTVSSVRHAWGEMRRQLGLPAEDREAGEKLIRRSMATLVRRRIGEANWRQGEMMLGHVKHSISDIYAIPDPANLGLALAATEAIIDEIEALCPGAYRSFTATGDTLKIVEGNLSR